MPNRFKDRSDAGRRLADALREYAGRDDVVVLGLPRGGVPVAREVARSLDVSLDVYVVRKLGAPGQPELAVGAIASGGARAINPDIVTTLGLTDEAIDAIAERERRELERRERAFRGDRPPVRLEDRVAILVDDGIATGASMRAAVAAARARDPARLIAAVPVAPPPACETLREVADEVICLITPEPFLAVGMWYERFDQVSDEAVASLLRTSDAP